MKETTIQKTSSRSNHMDYALYAFGGLGMELLVMMAETYLYGQAPETWPAQKQIIHWLATCCIWGCFGIALAKQLPAVPKNKITRKKLAATIPAVILSVIYTSLAWKGFKPAIEFSNLGLGKFSAQYIYYAFESLLVMLIIAHGQEAMENRFYNTRYIPFGGIFLAATWGLVHILTQGISTGIFSVIQAMLFGSVYVILNKNHKISYVAIALMFML